MLLGKFWFGHFVKKAHILRLFGDKELYDIFQYGVQIWTKLRHTDKKALAKKPKNQTNQEKDIFVVLHWKVRLATNQVATPVNILRLKLTR